MSSSEVKLASVPAGSFAKAASVGANTVKEPLPDRVSTRSVALSAATSVEKAPSLLAISAMLCVGSSEEFVGAGVAATEGRGVGAAVGATTGAAQVMAIFWSASQ